MRRKCIAIFFALCLFLGTAYYISLPDYYVFNGMSFSNQKTKDTTLKTVVYKYWNINDTIHKIEKNTIRSTLEDKRLLTVVQDISRRLSAFESS